jgi:hypothetical protein
MTMVMMIMRKVSRSLRRKLQAALRFSTGEAAAEAEAAVGALLRGVQHEWIHIVCHN